MGYDAGRGVLRGVRDDGSAASFSSTAEGHLEVALHAPRLPFGSIHAESMTPVFQTDPVYGISSEQIIETVGHLTGGVSSAANAGTGNLFTCSTGTTALSFASMQSRKRLRYRPGQGVIGRWTSVFSAPAASSILVSGFGTGESGYYVGYNGTSFGILHSTGGVRAIQTLTVTTGSSTAENITITLDDIEFNDVAVTNSGSTVKTAYEIASYDFTGWRAEQIGSTVIFLANSVGDKDGLFEVTTATDVAGSFVETLTGVAATDTWVPQASWNGDKLNGTGASGVTLDPAKGNVWELHVQYLGFGVVDIKCEVVPTANNADFVTVHTFRHPNTLTTPHLIQPSIPFTMSAYSAGSTTDVSVSAGSFAGFIEGPKRLNGPRFSYWNTLASTVTSGAYHPLFTVRNDSTYATRANQAVVNIVDLNVAHDDLTPVDFFLIRNGTLAGTPSFSYYATGSCTAWDTAATAVTFSDNNQVLWTSTVAEKSGLPGNFPDDVTIQPGETVTLAARTVTGTASYVSGSMNTREDQ